MSIFEKTVKDQNKITWLDLLSGVKEKHTSQDREAALLAGTSVDSAATESVMLQKWRPPWLFLRFLIVGLIFSAILVLLTIYFNNDAISLLYFIIPPCIVPVTLLIFFWEMNVPRNISIFQLAVCFVTGGLFSIVTSLVFVDTLNISAAFLAPLAEEPGKLIIALVIMKWISHKKGFKIYGMTGLTIGAAVGAGFASFETAMYVYNYGLATLIQRSISAFTGHVLYCAPYVAVAALLMSNFTFDLSFFKQKKFWLVFLISMLLHGAWNFLNSYSWWITFAVKFVIIWFMVLRIIRDCFGQIASQVHLAGSTSHLVSNLKLKCINGVHAGRTFALKHNEVIIGTDSDCNLAYPYGTWGVSDKQCKIFVYNDDLYLADVGSSEGTYLNGIKLNPFKGKKLQFGDVFWLGSENEKFEIN